MCVCVCVVECEIPISITNAHPRVEGFFIICHNLLFMEGAMSLIIQAYEYELLGYE